MSDPSRLTRYRDRGSTDRAQLDALLDEVLVGTVSTVIDGEPWSVPLLVAREGDRLLVHGSTGAGMLRSLAQGTPATVSVFALDGVVVAESAFDSSANYRSAVMRGRFTPVPRDEQDAALRILTDRLIPGRTAEVRGSTPKEHAATIALEMPIVEGMWILKARTGHSKGSSATPPADVWTGVVPMRLVAGEPQRDPWVPESVEVPPSVQKLVADHPGTPRQPDPSA